MKDPYHYFRIEAGELLEQLARNALDLERKGSEEGRVMQLLRLAHTLKGAARVVRLAEIAQLAHELEETLAPYRKGEPILRAGVDRVLAAVDAITKHVAGLPPPPGSQPTPAPAATAAAAATATETVIRVLRADAAEVDSVLQGLGEIGSELASLRQVLSSTEQRTGRGPAASAQGGAWRDMAAGMERIDRELRQARDVCERLSLVPLASVFNALERTARDAAHGSGKAVVFEAAGADIRIDGETLDILQGALIQLVRNAVAHGVEPPAQRVAMGKLAAGRIRLEVERQAQRVQIRCTDDGAGIDLEAVRQAIRQKTPSLDARSMDEAVLLATLLEGGISTRREVNELSGRGVGLDLVRDAMGRLNGELAARSTRHAGTTIELRVPLSRASLEVLVVEACGQQAAIPLDSVVRCTRVAPSDIVRCAQGDEIEHDGRLIPFAPLMLGAATAPSTEQSVTAVIVRGSGGTAAVAVQRLFGAQTVVLCPLPAWTPAEPLVMGMHLDVEGNPRMVLDPDVLALRQAPTVRQERPPARPILIVDDSLTTRMLESSILESAGFRVELAASAEEGLSMARQGDYALFLVDVEMPGMDGFSFVEHTRADPALREVPSVLVTSRNSPDDRRRGLAAGARDYIVKGEFDQVRFLERVNGLVYS